MNVDLLAKVRDRIAEVGDDHCDMRIWTTSGLKGSGPLDCGTTACIAGHTVAVAFEKVSFRQGSIEGDALRALAAPSVHLFYWGLWPEHYQKVLQEEGDAKGMLAILDALLDGTVFFDERGQLTERG